MYGRHDGVGVCAPLRAACIASDGFRLCVFLGSGANEPSDLCAEHTNKKRPDSCVSLFSHLCHTFSCLPGAKNGKLYFFQAIAQKSILYFTVQHTVPGSVIQQFVPHFGRTMDSGAFLHSINQNNIFCIAGAAAFNKPTYDTACNER